MKPAIPDAATLLDAVAGYLEQELLPTLEGYHRFQTRIAVNVVKTVMREQRLAAGHAAEDAAALQALLGHAGEAGALMDELAARLRAGEIAIDAPGLEACLRASLRRQLAIDSPAWAPD